MASEKDDKEIKQSIRGRLEFIESRLFWEGKISRSDLVDYFNISVPQATNDIKFYTDQFPANISYDKSAKEHSRGEKFQPGLIIPDSDDYRKQLLVHSIEKDKIFYYGSFPEFQNFHELNRPVDIEVLKRITSAINHKKSIFIKYHSMKRERGLCDRWVSPHALVYDGFRLHMRAYCDTHKSFRDFNLGRVEEVGEKVIESFVDFELDYQWTTYVDVIIKPHPSFIDHQRECIEKEYAMKDGKRTVSVRAASVYYFFRRYGFDITDYWKADVIKPEKQQIVLENKDEIDNQVNFLRKMSDDKLRTIGYQLV